MCPMRFKNFFKFIGEVRSAIPVTEFVEEPVIVSLPIHPSTSELAEQLLVDPEALKYETYDPGIYDESGDYYPQYSDDPSKLPEYIAPNDLGETAPESSPAPSEQSTEPSPAPEGPDKKE